MQIVLVDDTPEHLDLLAEFVQELRPGAKIRRLQDGLELPGCLEEGCPDLVLMDLVMPTISGFDLVQQIRQEHRWSDLPIVAVSGLHHRSEREALVRAGFSDHIVKPYEVDELVQVLDTHLPANHTTLFQ